MITDQELWDPLQEDARFPEISRDMTVRNVLTQHKHDEEPKFWKMSLVMLELDLH